MDGWILLSRSILQHWISSNPEYFKWWIEMLFMASYQDSEVLVGAHIVKLRRGQFVASLNYLATRWNVNKFRVRRFLKLLESENMIVITCDKKAQQITICNYERYQDVRNDDATMAQPPCNDDATMAQLNKRNKGSKEINNKEKNIKKEIAPPSSPQGEIPQKLSELILPEYSLPMEEWLEYKRQKRQTYKNDKSIAQCYKKLYKMSGGDPVEAMEIIHEAMANNWAGFFPLKDKRSNINNHGNNERGIDAQQARREQYERSIKEYVARQLASLANEG